MTAVQTPDARVLIVKRWVAKALQSRLPARTVATLTRGRIKTRGLTIYTGSPVVTDQTRASLFWGTYESAERRLIERHPPRSPLLVDLGASLGVVSSTAARLLEPVGSVVCLEANPDLIPLLARNLSINAPDVKAEVVHGAIDYSSARGGQVAFHSAGQHVASAISRDELEPSFTAPVRTLSDLVPEGRAFDLVCDVEGAEVGLLLHEQEVLTRCRRIYIEGHATTFDGRHYDPEDIWQLLRDRGFEMTDSYGNSSVWDASDS